MPFHRLHHALLELEDAHLLRRRAVLGSPQGREVVLDGQTSLNFCSNDYLGLANHPALIACAQKAVQTYGVGSGASHLVSGHSEAHEALEHGFAAFLGFPRALSFSTGYLANLAVITALVGRQDTIFADKLNHASLNDAMILSRAKIQRYPHLDIETLAQHLKKAPQRGKKLIITDAVFSMDGDLAPLPALCALAEQYDAWLYVDDAHGFGVLGEAGRGSVSHFNLTSPRLIYMATLGKALGVAGAVVAASETVIQWLIQRARPYVYTTAAPPALAAVALKSLEIAQTEGWRREHLQLLITLLGVELDGLPWSVLPSDTPIQPLIIGSAEEAIRLSHALKIRGIRVPAIRPPTVPKGTSRLRISLSAAHEPEDMVRLGQALHEIAQHDSY